MAENKQIIEKQEKLILLFKKVFSGPEGEEALRALMKQFHVVDGTYHSDPHQMYFREGQRSVITFLIDRIDVDMVKFRKMWTQTQDDFTTEV